MAEAEFAARVLNALVREGYVRAPAHASTEPDGFLSDAKVSGGVSLAELAELVRAEAAEDDDVEGFLAECAEAYRAETADLPAVRPGITRHDALAARLGHPVHPLGRAKAGLTAAEVAAYAPEYQPTFELAWTGVTGGVLHGELPSWWPSAASLGLPGDAVPFPVHPLTAAKGLVPTVAETRVSAAPTLSMRTLAVTGTDHVKVPLPTATLGRRNVRSIKPGTLVDGARVQRLLARIADAEGLPVLLADEQTYGHAHDPNLAFLVRRLPVSDAVPVAALLARTPEGPYVIEEVSSGDVRGFFDAYLRTLFAWNVALFERHGIALEAHQQNVSVTPRGELLLKDNDGAMLASGVFEDPRMVGGLEARARVFVTITLHLCAGALAFGLAERGLLPLPAALRLVRDRLDETVTDPFLRARTLEAPRLPSKAMLTAGTLVPKARTGSADINKHYGPPGPNYLRELPCR
ncbi:hypothetical protein GCM10022221_05390 [Actinocorallia aurea]